MCFVRANQKPERPVRTRPLSGIGVGRTTSNVEMRSLATSSRRSSSSAYSSRTLPLPTCTAVSDMGGLLLLGEAMDAVEHAVEMSDGGGEIEDLVEALRAETVGDRGVGARELHEVALFVPRAHRRGLHERVGVCALEPRLDERQQQAVREEQVVRRVEVAAHPLGIDDEPLDDPGEPVEHVVEREER